MNTGLGDAIDLSWKLAATIQGWGGPGLLPSYEAERRPVGAHNVAASGWAAQGVGVWRALVTPQINEPGAAGEKLREQVSASFLVNHGRMHGMRGAEFGYSYAGSAVIADEPGNLAQWDTNVYEPHARPGARLPHQWLRDGRAIQDLIGEGFTLLDLQGDCVSESLERAFRAIGAPLAVLRLDEPEMRAVYGRTVLLAPPADAVALARRVTGH
jgi:FAD binding domain